MYCAGMQESSLAVFVSHLSAFAVIMVVICSDCSVSFIFYLYVYLCPVFVYFRVYICIYIYI